MTLAASVAALVLAISPARSQEPPVDRGAAGVWQKLLKLSTTASLMHTTAHPDDEQGGMLAWVSRGLGARTTLLTLNRGESGDNAIGAELFDALGLIRTEELRLANRYYGVDQQYYTTVVDYGFSKRLDEAIDIWGREHVLRDMVRVIRTERPWVIVSRWQGNARDGHGQHQAAGLLSQEAFKAAADPQQFTEQLAAGLRPWRALKLYMGGAREAEAWHVAVDAGRYDAVLGDSYANLARYGLSFQRSQNSGRFVPSVGPAPAYFVRLAGAGDSPGKERGFFEGIDTSWRGLYKALGVMPPATADALLGAIEREVTAARQAFTMTDPSTAAPALARGLTAVRAAIAQLKDSDEVVHVLRRKEQQLVDALVAAVALEVRAVAVPPDTPEPSGPYAAFAPAATMGPVVPGQAFDVRLTAIARSSIPVTRGAISWGDGTAVTHASGLTTLAHPYIVTLKTSVRGDASPTYPTVSRASLAEPRYAVREGASGSDPSPPPPMTVTMRVVVQGVELAVSTPVQRRDNQQPFGYALRNLAIVPAYAVSVSPRQALLPARSPGRTLAVTVDVVNNQPKAGKATVALQAPSGWRVEPAATPIELGGGARTQVAFTVTPPAVGVGRYDMSGLVTADGQTFKEGYDVLEHRDLETRYFYRPSTVAVTSVDVKIAPNLKVGYVMGVGDELPTALTQLGATVQLLDPAALTSGPLGGFDAIVLGTRAYAVRADLRTNNRRLLDYARDGGNLVVLYNTQELDPATQAPFPATLPGTAEEVSEEDAVVTMLVPDHPLFAAPNRITTEDFSGWVEQRGSKFWSTWDPAYTPLLECHDRGQAAQRGGWLYARYGKGHYSYVAYAFHRQLPFGVPGAYRLMANLLSLGTSK